MKHVFSRYIPSGCRHDFFDVLFIHGVSVAPRSDKLIDTFNGRVETYGLSAENAQNHFVKILEADLASRTAFRERLGSDVSALARLCADAKQLARMPLDLPNDRATVQEYLEQAATVSVRPLPDLSEDGRLIVTFIGEMEGFDTAPLATCIASLDEEGAKITLIRNEAKKFIAELQQALVKIDDPATATKIKDLRLNRDLRRLLPDLVTELAHARQNVEQALQRIATISDRFQEIVA